MADVFEHNTWLYSADGPRLFSAGETIPAAGWVDAPGKVQPVSKVAQIAALRAEVAKMDPDGGGKIGGAVTNPQREALIAELEALNAQFDRRWGVAKLAAALEAVKDA